jgi:hypothetical protein
VRRDSTGIRVGDVFQSPPRSWVTSTPSHAAVGWVVDTKAVRCPSDDDHHALFAWCPVGGATACEVGDLAELDLWLDSGTTTAADRIQFARAKRVRATGSRPRRVVSPTSKESCLPPPLNDTGSVSRGF